MFEKLFGILDMENDPTADRNREPADPDNNNMQVEDNDDGELMEGDNEAFEEDYEDEEFGPQEFSALNSQLDQLQSALDSLESRNDDIHSKLLELLKSSREIRQVMVEENNQNRAMEEDVGEDNPGKKACGAPLGSVSEESAAGPSSTQSVETKPSPENPNLS